MSITDAQLLFSSDQVLTSGDVLSTNAIDLKAVGWNGNVGSNAPLVVWYRFPTTVADDFGSDGTLKIVVRTKASADLSSGATDLLTTNAIPLTSLTSTSPVGQIVLPDDGLLRYVALYYDVTSMTPSAGTVTAGLTVRGAVQTA